MKAPMEQTTALNSSDSLVPFESDFLEANRRQIRQATRALTDGRNRTSLQQEIEDRGIELHHAISYAERSMQDLESRLISLGLLDDNEDVQGFLSSSFSSDVTDTTALQRQIDEARLYVPVNEDSGGKTDRSKKFDLEVIHEREFHHQSGEDAEDNRAIGDSSNKGGDGSNNSTNEDSPAPLEVYHVIRPSDQRYLISHKAITQKPVKLQQILKIDHFKRQMMRKESTPN